MNCLAPPPIFFQSLLIGPTLSSGKLMESLPDTCIAKYLFDSPVEFHIGFALAWGVEIGPVLVEVVVVVEVAAVAVVVVFVVQGGEVRVEMVDSLLLETVAEVASPSSS